MRERENIVEYRSKRIHAKITERERDFLKELVDVAA